MRQIGTTGVQIHYSSRDACTFKCGLVAEVEGHDGSSCCSIHILFALVEIEGEVADFEVLAELYDSLKGDAIFAGAGGCLGGGGKGSESG